LKGEIKMATQKEMRTMREEMLEKLQEVSFTGYEVVGIVKDGFLLFHEEKMTYIVIKPIVKKEDFDAQDSLEEYAEKIAAQKERELEKARKAEKRKEKD